MPSKKIPKLQEKSSIIKESFIDKELLQASLVQRELMKTIETLSDRLENLNSTLELIQEHEFIQLHKSKWRIVSYQMFLGFLFAIGTVMGLVFISWATYTFFKDSEILKQIVDNQLKSRSFNLGSIKEKAVKDAGTSILNPYSKSETLTGTGKDSQSGSKMLTP